MPKIDHEGIAQILQLASGRGAMFDALKRLYTHEFLSGLNDDQIYDLYGGIYNDHLTRLKKHKIKLCKHRKNLN